jgi:hypothetical protein
MSFKQNTDKRKTESNKCARSSFILLGLSLRMLRWIRVDNTSLWGLSQHQRVVSLLFSSRVCFLTKKKKTLQPYLFPSCFRGRPNNNNIRSRCFCGDGDAFLLVDPNFLLGAPPPLSLLSSALASLTLCTPTRVKPRHKSPPPSKRRFSSRDLYFLIKLTSFFLKHLSLCLTVSNRNSASKNTLLVLNPLCISSQ